MIRQLATSLQKSMDAEEETTMIVYYADSKLIARNASENANAPADCRKLEIVIGGKHPVLAYRDGQLVADSDGWRPFAGSQQAA